MRTAEVKYTRAGIATTSRGTVALADVSLITPTLSLGNTSATRVGNSIRIKKFHVDVLMAPEPATTALPFRNRVLVFRWKDGGNKVLTSTDMAAFYNDGASDTAGTGVWNDQCRRLSDRFEVLHDSVTPVMHWDATTPTVTNIPTNTKILANDYRHSFDVPYLHRVITYDDASTEPSTNVYILVCAIDVGSSAGNNPTTILGDVGITLHCDYVDM